MMLKHDEFKLELSPNITLVVKKQKLKQDHATKRTTVKRCSDSQDWVENETNEAYKKAPRGNY